MSPAHSIRSASLRAAALAISLRGWRTVVSWNTSQEALGTSSKPRTETASGTATPSDWAASIAPRPMTSLPSPGPSRQSSVTGC